MESQGSLDDLIRTICTAVPLAGWGLWFLIDFFRRCGVGVSEGEKAKVAVFTRSYKADGIGRLEAALQVLLGYVVVGAIVIIAGPLVYKFVTMLMEQMGGSGGF